MSAGDLIFALGALGVFIASLLYVVIGQLTVRRLRKSPETKGGLGVQFASGWDIFNFAQAVALPKWITNKLAESPLSGFYANRELLEKSTSVFERRLASVFYWVSVISVLLILSLALA